MASTSFANLLTLAATATTLALLGGCPEPPPPDIDGLEAIANCTYINPFSEQEECREYLGTNWTMDSAEGDCRAQDDSVFVEGECEYESVLGACVLGAGSDDVYQLVAPGDDEGACAGSERGCEVFGGGQWVPAEVCGGVPDQEFDAIAFINPELLCVEPMPGEPPGENDGEVCTWDSISGCTEEGRYFADYAVCDNVRSQRGYYPVSEDTYETPSDSPLFTDPDYQAELAWVTEQVEACGCVCCHDSRVTPEGASNWDIQSDKEIWTDGFYASGLAIAAGWINSDPLGAYPPEDNHGFGRSVSGIPSTDQQRMKAFFEAELVRRGFSEEDFADYDPIPAIFYNQEIYEPGRCENGEGVTRDGDVVWGGGDARYMYVLEVGSANPGVPPNRDQPDGTLWLLEVYWNEAAMESPVSYPEGPARAEQRVTGPTLVEGEDYYLYVQADVGAPITRCIFTY